MGDTGGVITTAAIDLALQSDPMCTALSRHLVAARHDRILDCRVTRYRHRPGRRLLAQYAVRVRDAAGAEHDLRVTGQWHEGGHSEALFRKLAARVAAAAVPWSAALPPVFFDRATGMLGTTYPWDRRLPALPEIVAGRSADLLAPMLAWLGVESGALERVAVDTVRYREQLNAVCRYTVGVRRGLAAPAESRFFVKAYADDAGAQAAAILALLAAATPARSGTARVQRAAAYVGRLKALVLPETPGVGLDRLDLGHRRAIERTLAETASALARFGRLTVDLPSSARSGTRLAAAGRAVAALGPACPDRANDCRALLAAAARVGTSSLGPTHGDIKLEHVLIDGSAVFLIDLDSCHLGDPLWDLALLQARWFAARDRCDHERALAGWGCRTLQAAYLAGSAADGVRRLPVLQALALLDVAAGIVKRREPDWRARSGRLLDAAVGRLGGRT